jgi:hypothetical protein
MSSIKNIFANGTLVDLDISSWSGEKQLTAEDLGIEASKLPKSFKLGKKSLVPPSVIAIFKHLDYKARNLLITMSYPFPFGEARFLPKKLLPDFDEKYQIVKQEFDAQVVDLVQNFQTHKMAMRQEFIAAAKEAHDRLTKIKGLDDLKPVDEYVNDFLARIEKDYPTPDSLFSRFDMNYAIYQMELPDLTEATINDVAEENTKVRLLEEAFQKKMRKSIEAYAEKMVKDNRDRANVVIQTLTENLNAKKKYTEASARAVEKMINNFLALDIIDDARLKRTLTEFKAKYIDGNTSAIIRKSAQLQKEMLDDITAISAFILDAAEIKALADGYREKVKI